MTVLLIKNTENAYFPPQIPPVLTEGKIYPENRNEHIIQHLVKLSEKNVIKSSEFSAQKVREFPNQICRSSNMPNYFFCYRTETEEIIVYQTKEVKSHRPWSIVKIGDSECIHYFSEKENYHIINEETMYAVED